MPQLLYNFNRFKITLVDSQSYSMIFMRSWNHYVQGPLHFPVLDTQLYRRVPPVYSDGTYEPAGANRPNPIEISDAVLHGETGSGSYRNKSAFLVFFGKSQNLLHCLICFLILMTYILN